MTETKSTVQGDRIVVGFDMDGVIIDHTGNKIALAESFAVRLRPEETHSERLPAKFAHNEYIAFQNELYGNSPFALSAPLMEGARDVLSLLKKNAISFVLISRRRIPEHAIALLQARGLWGDIFSEQNAFFVQSPSEKNIVGIREGVTHFFDDERKVLSAMKDIRERYLMDTFHQFNDETELPRVHDWEMIRNVLLSGGA